jgi:hypothetical protein
LRISKKRKKNLRAFCELGRLLDPRQKTKDANPEDRRADKEGVRNFWIPAFAARQADTTPGQAAGMARSNPRINSGAKF